MTLLMPNALPTCFVFFDELSIDLLVGQFLRHWALRG